MFAGMTGMARSSSSSRICTSATDRGDRRAAAERGDRHVQPRVGQPARCAARSRCASRGSGAGWPGRRRSACGSAASAAAPGSTTRRSARASSRLCAIDCSIFARDACALPGRRHDERARRRARAAIRPGRPSRSALIASRRVTRLTPKVSASSRSGGSRSPSTSTPSRMPWASRSTVTSKALRTGTGENTVRAHSASTLPTRHQRTAALDADRCEHAADERGEQRRARVHLGMPLHADHPGRARAARPPRRRRRSAQPVATSPSPSRSHAPGGGRSRPAPRRRGSPRSREPGASAHVVPAVHADGRAVQVGADHVRQVLAQVAAERDVEHLHAAAHREHRQVALERGAGERELPLVAVGPGAARSRRRASAP